MKSTVLFLRMLAFAVVLLCSGHVRAATSVTLATMGFNSVTGVQMGGQFSNAGSKVSVVKAAGTGVYVVSFSGMLAPTLPHHVQLSTSHSIICAPSSESGLGNDFVVGVQCYSHMGQPKAFEQGEALEIVLRTDDGPSAGHFAYARNTVQRGMDSFFSSWNSRGGTNTIIRTSLGHYTFRFGAVQPPNTGGTALVTTRTPFTRCAIINWTPISPAGTDVNVACTHAGTSVGSFTDASVSVYFGEKPLVAIRDWAFAWADQPTFTPPSGGTYIPSPFYQGMSNGGQVQARGSGTYQVKTPGVRRGSTPGAGPAFRLLSTYGDPDVRCGASATIFFDEFIVTCSVNGAVVPSRFVINVMSP